MNQVLPSKSFSDGIKGHKLWRLHIDQIDGSVLTRWALQWFNKNLVSLLYRLLGAEVPLAFGLWGMVLGSRPLVFVIKRAVLLTGSDKRYHTAGKRATDRAWIVMSLNSSWYICAISLLSMFPLFWILLVSENWVDQTSLWNKNWFFYGIMMAFFKSVSWHVILHLIQRVLMP